MAKRTPGLLSLYRILLDPLLLVFLASPFFFLDATPTYDATIRHQRAPLSFSPRALLHKARSLRATYPVRVSLRTRVVSSVLATYLLSLSLSARDVTDIGLRIARTRPVIHSDHLSIRLFRFITRRTDENT